MDQVSQDGFISFSDASPAATFSNLTLNGHTILAPVYAMQDCSCSGSSVTYQVFLFSFLFSFFLNFFFYFSKFFFVFFSFC